MNKARPGTVPRRFILGDRSGRYSLTDLGDAGRVEVSESGHSTLSRNPGYHAQKKGRVVWVASDRTRPGPDAEHGSVRGG